MHHKLLRALMALCIVGMLLGAASPVSAREAGVDGTSGTTACSTWQYRVSEHGTLRDVPGGTVVGHAYYPDLANIRYSSSNGWWYFGNFYYSNGVRYATDRWIEAYHLSYLTCW